MSAEVQSGYKQTEVGLIPEDWEVKNLGECLASTPRYGINAAAVPYSDRLPVYIRITDISTDGRFAPEKLVSVDNPQTSNYYLLDGDIVLARTGASVGKSYKYDTSDGPLVFAGFLILIRPNPTKLVSSYIASYLSTKTYWNWVGVMSTRSGQPGINGKEYSQLPLPIPSISEQREISITLSDIDHFVKNLDKLIAKKRDIQQAAMQQLLTGQRRLPGFSGKWLAVKARDIGLFRGGSGFPNRFQGETSGAFPFYKVSDMNNEGNEIFMSTANNYIAEDVRKAIGAVIFPTNSIVFAKVGAAVFLERKKILTTPSCLDNNMAAFIVDERRVCVRFMHYSLLNIRLGDLVSTTALPSLSNPVLSNIELILPPVFEQQAIATILSDMDSELATLEARRDKARHLKQGMMQELLTGRVRLTNSAL